MEKVNSITTARDLRNALNNMDESKLDQPMFVFDNGALLEITSVDDSISDRVDLNAQSIEEKTQVTKNQIDYQYFIAHTGADYESIFPKNRKDLASTHESILDAIQYMHEELGIKREKIFISLAAMDESQAVKGWENILFGEMKE